MADELFAIADSHIFIGGALSTQAADFVAADFSGQSWVEIDGWKTMGAFGDAAEVITTNLINRGRALKQKGTANAGTMENVFAVIDGDAGQTAAKAASAANDSYAFKMELSTGETIYFIALVMTTSRPGGEANAVHDIGLTLEINSNIVEA
jgi:hypothetical protein